MPIYRLSERDVLLIRLATDATRSAAGLALGLAATAGSLVAPIAAPLAAGVGAGADRMRAVPVRLLGSVGELLDAGGRRAGRRVWSADGRAHVEVRGLTGHGPRHRRLAEDVTAALRRVDGVRWAEVNAVTQHVLLAFDEDTVDIDHLVEAVEAVEAAHGTSKEDFSRLEPDHPSARAPEVLAAVAVLADVAGLAVTTAGRVLRLPALPVAIRAPLLLADMSPRIRHGLNARLGRAHTELLLSVTGSVLHAITQGPAPLAVDGVHHLLTLVEARARLEVWHRRERELVGDGAGLPAEIAPRRPRPVPLPDGAVEALGDRASLASLLGAGGLLAFGGDPRQAAELLVATMPRAARQGREAFAAVLGRGLTARGVVPMDAAALRRLDRVSVVVIDSSSLCTAEPRLLSALSLCDDRSDAEVWRIAFRVLVAADDRPALSGDGPWAAGPWRFHRTLDADHGTPGGPVAMALDLIDSEGRLCGRVRVGCETDPLADAVLAASRAASCQVVMTEHDSAGELLAWADEVVPADGALAVGVRDLQADGHGVLLISAADDDALHASDVGVAVVCPGRPVCWSADLLCGPGLGDVWRVVTAVETAHAVSERAARIAVGGSALGALLVVARGRRIGGGPGILAPVHSAALAAVLHGAYSAFRMGRRTTPAAVVRGNWHDLTPWEVLQRLEPMRRGRPEPEPPPGWPAVLSTAQAAIHAAGRVTLRVQFIAVSANYGTALARSVVQELRDPMTPVLAFGAAASAIVGSGVDAVLVASVMSGNAVISGAQRLRAERALRHLLIGEEVQARRVEWTPPERTGDAARDDTDTARLTGLAEAPTERVPAGDLWLSDIVRVHAGDVVPADLRLLASEDLEVDESSLTGESLPVGKSPTATPGADLDERTCMLFQGCTVLAGTGFGLVVAVGGGTEAGRAAAVAESAAAPAGMQARLAELTRVALPAAGIGGLAVTGMSALRDMPLRPAVASGVAVAVAAVPEGLPLVATVAQLAAARRLARRGILARSSRTLEALGRVDTLCFDKTGTLTWGRLAVTRVADIDGALPMDGVPGTRVLRTAERACPHPNGGSVRRVVHATDKAVLEAVLSRLGDDEAWTARAELPFETNRGYSAALGTVGSTTRLVVKGAPEIVLAACTRALGRDGLPRELTEPRREACHTAVAGLAEDGLRVLAVAEKYLHAETPADTAEIASLVNDLTLLGFVGIADPPRPNAREAVASLADAGVRVTMITGDHPRTAASVAAELAIPDAHRVMTGAEFDRLRKQERAARVVDTAVFARVSPQQKVRIIQALQNAGRVVAMTGDGSNDAAAIRLADVGIALAGHGSAAARSAADLVLAEPDPALITDALLEGRALWGRVRDAASILVGGNAGEVAFTLIGTAVAGRAPLNTRQLLLVNMLTDMMPALAVALAPVKQDHDGNGGTAAAPVTGLWGPALARSLALRGGTTALGAAVAWGCGRATGRRARAGTMALGALVGTQLAQTLLTGHHSPLVVGTVVTSAAALFAVVETPAVSQFFGCTPLGPVAWGIVAGATVCATVAGMAVPRVVAALR